MCVSIVYKWFRTSMCCHTALWLPYSVPNYSPCTASLRFTFQNNPPTRGGCRYFTGNLLRLYFTVTRTRVIIYIYISSRLTGCYV